MPKLLIEHGVFNNVLFTYICKRCHSTTISPWQGAVTRCPICREGTMIHPNNMLGCNVETMNELYNLHDLYVQYSNCEGLGLGVLEAAAAWTPVASIDYSAMASLNDTLDGIKLNYKLARDIVTDAKKAIPDNDSNAKKIAEFINLPKDLQKIKGHKTRQLAEKYFNWDDVADKWIEHLENIELKDNQGQWGNEPIEKMCLTYDEKSPYFQIKDALKITGRSDLIHSNAHFILHYQNMLHRAGLELYGISEDNMNRAINNFAKEGHECRQILAGNADMKVEDFIEYADVKEVANL